MCCVAPAAYVDYYADNYTDDDSLSFYFIFLTENSVEIFGTDNAVRVCKSALLCIHMYLDNLLHSYVTKIEIIHLSHDASIFSYLKYCILRRD